ncbi:hypothetical protein ACWGS9_19065 [Bradyrhizobium sp. Arg314]
MQMLAERDVSGINAPEVALRLGGANWTVHGWADESRGIPRHPYKKKRGLHRASLISV